MAGVVRDAQAGGDGDMSQLIVVFVIVPMVIGLGISLVQRRD